MVMVSQRILALVFLLVIAALLFVEKRELEAQARAAHVAHAQSDAVQRRARDALALEQFQQERRLGGSSVSEKAGSPRRERAGERGENEVDATAAATTPRAATANGGLLFGGAVHPPPPTREGAARGEDEFLDMDLAAPVVADPACPLPPLHPAKFALKLGWGVRKHFDRCGRATAFSRVVDDTPASSSSGGPAGAAAAGTVVVEFTAGDGAAGCAPGAMSAFGFTELEDTDFERMQSTLDAEMRQNALKHRFSLHHLEELATRLPQPQERAPGGGVWEIRDVRHPYVVARCGNELELHVTAAPLRHPAASAAAAAAAPAPSIPAGGMGGLRNVLHIMFDSTSIHALRRSAPHIMEWMARVNSDPSGAASVFPMRHFHAVSCCSPGNQIPAYSGNMNGEGDPFVRAEPPQNSRDWLWNIAAARGFRTFWSLDNCPDKSARDYHAFPAVHSRVVAPLCLAGVLLSRKDATCLAGKTVDAHVIDGLESFWARHAGERKFAAVQFITPHEETEKLLMELDVLVARYLARLEVSGALNNTAVIFWSDHGINFGRYASTHDGEIEKMFPFANVIVPRWLAREKVRSSSAGGTTFGANLRANANRLLTPYDLYEVARTLLYHPDAPPPFAHDTARNPPLPHPRESHIMASFRKPITPVNVLREVAAPHRGCMDANIPMEFCTCIPWAASVAPQHAAFVSRAVAAHSATLANISARCHAVELEATLAVEVQVWPTEYKPEGKETAKKIWMAPKRDMVRVRYRTRPPGAGLFEAVFSVSKSDEDVFDLARIDRVDAMGKKCGVVEKRAEHLCVCK